MLYAAEKGQASLAICGDIMPSRRLAVFREPEFLALRDILRGADACFANLESMVLRYGEGTPAIRTGTHMVTEPELLDDLKWFGFNMLSCANSHSLNFGEAGLLLLDSRAERPQDADFVLEAAEEGDLVHAGSLGDSTGRRAGIAVDREEFGCRIKDPLAGVMCCAHGDSNQYCV